MFTCIFTCPLPGKKTCCHGPGYASPLDAVKNGPRETLLYVTCVRRNVTPGKPDFLATVDVDPQSDTYSQVRYLQTGETIINHRYSNTPLGHLPLA